MKDREVKIAIFTSIIIALVNFNLIAQCPGSKVCPSETIFFSSSPTPTDCNLSASCIGLNTGYLLFSIPDTIILEGLDSETFEAANYAGCVGVISICYDLGAIQNLVDILLNNNSCCSLFNSVESGFCDSIRSKFGNSNEVNGISAMISILQIFSGGNLTPNSLNAGLSSFNSQVNDFIVQLACDGLTGIGYCVDLDFDPYNLSRSYEITNEVCPFDDCIDSIYITPTFLINHPHQLIFRASKLIEAAGTISSFESIEFRAGEEVILSPFLSVELGATFEVLIEPCIITELRIPSHANQLFPEQVIKNYLSKTNN